MSDEQTIYEGRAISKMNFRAYVYGINGKKLLVNSWDEYKNKIASGEWFGKKEDVTTVVVDAKPKSDNKEWLVKEEEIKTEFETLPKKSSGKNKKGGA